MKKDIIDQIIEVRKQRDDLQKRKKELDTLRIHILEEIKDICVQMWELENEERLLKEQFRKEHTREFYKPMDEVDICERIRSYGSIKGSKF